MELQSLTPLLAGDAGTAQTVQTMTDIVAESLVDPLVVETAGRITAPADPSNACAKAIAIRQWLAHHIHFVLDPVNRELLRTPHAMLETMAVEGYARGDCDDVAMMGAALGLAVGLPARWELLGFAVPQRGTVTPFEHVYTSLFVGAGAPPCRSGWYELDTTRPAQMPPSTRITRHEVLEVEV